MSNFAVDRPSHLIQRCLIIDNIGQQLRQTPEVCGFAEDRGVGLWIEFQDIGADGIERIQRSLRCVGIVQQRVG